MGGINDSRNLGRACLEATFQPTWVCWHFCLPAVVSFGPGQWDWDCTELLVPELPHLHGALPPALGSAVSSLGEAAVTQTWAV